MKNQCIEGDCLKRGAWTVCRFKRGLSKKKEAVFLGGGDTPMHTMHQLAFSPVGIVVLAVLNLRRKKVLWISEKMSQ